MVPPQGDSVRTRPSLLRRIKRWDDRTGWEDFYRTYEWIVRRVALQSGLSETEADDVVQETFVEVAEKMPAFEYDRERGSFKAWLLKLARWRILDHLRRRRRSPIAVSAKRTEDSGTSPIERLPAPVADVDALWEKAWKAELMQTALRNVRRRVAPEKYQAFDLYVHREWPAQKVARTLGLTLNQVYLAKHRITESVKAEVGRLEQREDPGLELAGRCPRPRQPRRSGDGGN